MARISLIDTATGCVLTTSPDRVEALLAAGGYKLAVEPEPELEPEPEPKPVKKATRKRVKKDGVRNSK